MGGRVTIEESESVATVWLDNPSRRNALSRSMWMQLGEAFRGFGAREDLRCIVMRGVGPEAFSSGADIEEFSSVRANRAQAEEFGGHVHAALNAVRSCPLPVVAAIQGVCVGGGLELASVCDIRLCTSESRFGIPVALLGATLAYAELAPLVALVGSGHGARTAARRANLVVGGSARQRPRRARTRLAGFRCGRSFHHRADMRRCATFGPRAQALHQPAHGHAGIVHRGHRRRFDCFDWADYQVGYEAFLSKTRPRFTGR